MQTIFPSRVTVTYTVYIYLYTLSLARSLARSLSLTYIRAFRPLRTNSTFETLWPLQNTISLFHNNIQKNVLTAMFYR